MKLVYIYSEITIKGGTDKVIVAKANYFVRHGYEVTVITEAQMGRALAFPLDPRVKHIDMGLDFNSQYACGMLKRAYIYKSLMCKYRRRLTHVLQEEKADIVITTVGRGLDFVTDIHDGSRKIAEAHTTKAHLRSLHLMEQRGGFYRLMAKYMRRKMCRKVAQLDAIVLLTDQDAANWSEAKRTVVIPNSLPSFPSASAALQNKRVIMVGRYNDAKGYDYLIPAWEKVHQRHPDWVLDVYGSGELHDQVVGWIAERHLEKSIVLHEPTSEIMEKYMESSICVLSSRYEGFSMVLVEAMSCGVPCVSFDCPHGPRTIIANGEDGLLVDYLNVDALADGLCKLMEDEKLRMRLGENARKSVLRYSEERVMGLWTNLFNSLVR